MQIIWGGALAILLVVGLGGWSAVTEIESAVIAPATVVVEGSRKQVQHDTGGIVEEIRVKEGELVKKGDTLIRLDGKQIAAEIAALEKRIFDFEVRRHRLRAERSGKTELGLPDELVNQSKINDELAEAVFVQSNLLKTRIAVYMGKVSQLEERIVQLQQEVAGLKETRSATLEELALYKSELKGLEDLRGKKLVNMSRYNILMRSSIEKRGILGRTIADIARGEGRISETRLQIIELKSTVESESLKERENIEAELSQLTEKLRVAQDRFSRLEIRASDDGHIHELQAHTIGGVIRAGDVIAYVVPAASKLVVDAHVQTIDRDQIYPGMQARTRFTAFSQRTTPELTGRIERIASDQSGGRDNIPPYYLVRITLPPDELKRLHGLDLVPGMPAEVMMTARPRTVISYLMKPIADQFNRAFRDD